MINFQKIRLIIENLYSLDLQFTYCDNSIYILFSFHFIIIFFSFTFELALKTKCINIELLFRQRDEVKNRQKKGD